MEGMCMKRGNLDRRRSGIGLDCISLREKEFRNAFFEEKSTLFSLFVTL